MYAEEQVDLKCRMKVAGITIKAVSQRLRRPYSTIGGQLGGFIPLEASVRVTIENMILEAESKKIVPSCLTKGAVNV